MGVTVIELSPEIIEIVSYNVLMGLTNGKTNGTEMLLDKF